MNSQVYGRSLAGFDHFVVDLFLHFRNNLFYPGRMNTSIGNQLMKRQATSFPTHRIKGTDDNRFGRIINDNLNAGSCF